MVMQVLKNDKNADIKQSCTMLLQDMAKCKIDVIMQNFNEIFKAVMANF